MNFQIGDIGDIPIVFAPNRDAIAEHAKECVSVSKMDWDSSETSWDFGRLPLFYNLDLRCDSTEQSVEQNQCAVARRCACQREREEEINESFANCYGLQGEVSAEVPDDQITLYRPDRAEDIKRLYGDNYFSGLTTIRIPG